MSLTEKIAALEEITPQTVRKFLTFEDFKFEILEAMNKDPNYDSLLTIFYEVQEVIASQPNYNIISERITLKGLYLNLAFGIDIEIINALVCVEPIIKLDFDLNQLLKDDEFFKYVEESYKEHKRNTEFNFNQLVGMIKDINFEEYLTKMQGSIEDLNKLAK